jgi:hypothetical protein
MLKLATSGGTTPGVSLSRKNEEVKNGRMHHDGTGKCRFQPSSLIRHSLVCASPRSFDQPAKKRFQQNSYDAWRQPGTIVAP